MNILFFARTHRNRDAYSFELISPVAMFDGEGARDEALNAKLVQLFRQGANQVFSKWIAKRELGEAAEVAIRR